VRVPPNRVAQVKTLARDGYRAVQLVGGKNAKPSRVTRPLKGHFRKTSIQAGSTLCEFRVAESEVKKAGSQIGVEIFSEGQRVQLTGTSKGKGFAGTIKRHNFRGQDNSHGNSLSHRVMGSVGQCQTPGRVFKGKKMPGQMGNARVCVKNIEIVKVDKERELLWLKGAVPGCRNSTLLIRHLSDIDIQAVSPDVDAQADLAAVVTPSIEQPPVTQQPSQQPAQPSVASAQDDKAPSKEAAQQSQSTPPSDLAKATEDSPPEQTSEQLAEQTATAVQPSAPTTAEQPSKPTADAASPTAAASDNAASENVDSKAIEDKNAAPKNVDRENVDSNNAENKDAENNDIDAKSVEKKNADPHKN